MFTELTKLGSVTPLHEDPVNWTIQLAIGYDSPAKDYPELAQLLNAVITSNFLPTILTTLKTTFHTNMPHQDDTFKFDKNTYTGYATISKITLKQLFSYTVIPNDELRLSDDQTKTFWSCTIKIVQNRMRVSQENLENSLSTPFTQSYLKKTVEITTSEQSHQPSVSLKSRRGSF
ncbi:MAG: hypothetical protein KIT27_11515 [Legionellales bacterium]|nr:hypothetical protein [Legionellales bacterium]